MIGRRAGRRTLIATRASQGKNDDDISVFHYLARRVNFGILIDRRPTYLAHWLLHGLLAPPHH